MPIATITSKGQITIPKKIRDALRLRPGDQVDFVLDDAGVVSLRAGSTHINDLKGLLLRPGRPPVSTEDMARAIARFHAAGAGRVGKKPSRTSGKRS